MFKDRKKILLLIVLVLVVIIPFVSIGYSALSTVLNIRSDVASLHIVLRTEDFPDEIEYLMDNDVCMERYEGEVTDEVNNTVQAKNVYFNKCSNNRNIIFNNMCWQMIRTTETGGIKMIYNGEVVDGKCESTRGTHKGFQYISSSYYINGRYRYGTYYTVNSDGTFTVNDSSTWTWNSTNANSLIGMYTCGSTSTTCSTLYLITGYITDYYAEVKTLTIVDTNYAQVGVSKYNTGADLPDGVGYMFKGTDNVGTSYPGSNTYMFGTGYTYNSGSGTYTLTGTQTISGWANNYNQLSNAHYTCWNTTGTCASIAYVFYADRQIARYVNLNNNIPISTYLDDLLHGNNANSKNSEIKDYIDFWFEKKLDDKTSFLEDVVYCANRNLYSVESWNPSNSITSGGISFRGGNYLGTDLSCNRITDSFAVGNNSAKLTYPTALITVDEWNYLPESLKATGNIYWTMSPSYYGYFYDSYFGGGVYMINATGVNRTDLLGYDYGVRPAISLKNGVSFRSGTGSETDPWIVDESEKLHDKIVNLSNVDSLITKYQGQVTDSVGVTKSASKVYFDKDPDKRNVIFGAFCWQVIRTTETGGTKVIYNGIPENGKCGSTRASSNTFVNAGYADANLTNEHTYGDSYTYDENTNTFTLLNTFTATWSDATYGNLLGKYYCDNANCSNLMKVTSYLSNTFARVESLYYRETPYYLIGFSNYNREANSVAMVGYKYNTIYKENVSRSSSSYLYGSSFTYDNTTHMYTLSGTLHGPAKLVTLVNGDVPAHYTCWNTSGTCETISYLYSTGTNLGGYIDISGGKNINDALNEMLNVNNVNANNSTIKDFVDNWYAQNMTGYTSKLEDVVYCNDRNILDYGTFNPDGGWSSPAEYSNAVLVFKNAANNSVLSCSNATDQFAVGNNKAKLTYPVALLTKEEQVNNSAIMNGSTWWWTMSPYAMITSWNVWPPNIANGDSNNYSQYNGVGGVRPVISLANENIVVSGSGSEEDPWIVE